MNKIELIGGVLAGMILFSGCSTVNESNKTPLPEFSPTTSSVTTPTAGEPTEEPTEAPTAIPTAEVDSYPIDVTKLYGVKDFNDVLANPESCVMAPPIEKIDDLNKWLNNDLRPLLKSDKSNPNIVGPGFSYNGNNGSYLMMEENLGDPVSISGEVAIFCTKYKDEIHPVVVLTVAYNGGNEFDTFALVLSDNRSPESGRVYGGADRIKDMFDNDNKIRALMIIVSDTSRLSEVSKKLLELGSVAFDPMAHSFDGIRIGPGELLMPGK